MLILLKDWIELGLRALTATINGLLKERMDYLKKCIEVGIAILSN